VQGSIKSKLKAFTVGVSLLTILSSIQEVLAAEISLFNDRGEVVESYDELLDPNLANALQPGDVSSFGLQKRVTPSKACVRALLKSVDLITDNLRVAFGMSDSAAPSMQKMIDGLQTSQGVSVEYDGSLGAKRIGGASVTERSAIVLGSKAQNENTKAFLLHEVVHSTTDYRIRTERSIAACAQGVKFRGMLINAPPGYRASFRIDEITAHRKESLYRKSVAEAPETPYLMRVKMEGFATEKGEVAQQFESASVELLNLVQEKLTEFARENLGKIYPFTTAPRPNSPGILNLKMSLNPLGTLPVEVEIPIPADTPDHLATAMEVLNAARSSIERSH
jgi:hypothetical protein